MNTPPRSPRANTNNTASVRENRSNAGVLLNASSNAEENNIGENELPPMNNEGSRMDPLRSSNSNRLPQYFLLRLEFYPSAHPNERTEVSSLKGKKGDFETLFDEFKDEFSAFDQRYFKNTLMRDKKASLFTNGDLVMYLMVHEDVFERGLEPAVSPGNELPPPRREPLNANLAAIGNVFANRAITNENLAAIGNVFGNSSASNYNNPRGGRRGRKKTRKAKSVKRKTQRRR